MGRSVPPGCDAPFWQACVRSARVDVVGAAVAAWVTEPNVGRGIRAQLVAGNGSGRDDGRQCGHVNGGSHSCKGIDPDRHWQSN